MRVASRLFSGSKSPPYGVEDNSRMSFTVFLGNLPAWVTADDIRGWLAAENLVADAIKVIRNPETQESKGFAFIDAPNSEEMNSIIRRFDRAPLEDRMLRANPAQPPKPKGSVRPPDRPGAHPGGPGGHAGGHGGYGRPRQDRPYSQGASNNAGHAAAHGPAHGSQEQVQHAQDAGHPAGENSGQGAGQAAAEQRPPRRGKRAGGKKPGNGSNSAFAEELAKAL
jgi:RNA recognition motif-containing protein